MRPADYARRYAEIWTPEFSVTGGTPKLVGGGGVLTPALSYCNLNFKNAAGNSVGDRLAFKDHLLGFFGQRRGEASSGITYNKASGYSLRGSNRPIIDCPKSAFMASFSGKASPERLADVVQFIAYWRAWKTHIEGKTVSPVSNIVRDYLGTDCNGFIGNYLRTKFPGVAVTPSTTEESFSTAGPRKTTIHALRTDDVLVWEGFHHVSLVHDVRVKSATEAELDIAESRGKDHGGAQLSYWRIAPRVDDKSKKVIDGQFTVFAAGGGGKRGHVVAAVRVTGT
jgi:hypothetical protein